MFQHILLATDGSAASHNAARMAVDLARVHGARLTTLYVVDPYPYLGVGEANPLGLQAYTSAAQQHAAEAHDKVLAMCEGTPRVNCQARVAEEVAPATGILDAAREVGADLIVVGSHGRSGVARMVVGSVAAKVVAQSTTPVLVAR